MPVMDVGSYLCLYSCRGSTFLIEILPFLANLWTILLFSAFKTRHISAEHNPDLAILCSSTLCIWFAAISRIKAESWRKMLASGASRWHSSNTNGDFFFQRGIKKNYKSSIKSSIQYFPLGTYIQYTYTSTELPIGVPLFLSLCSLFLFNVSLNCFHERH